MANKITKAQLDSLKSLCKRYAGKDENLTFDVIGNDTIYCFGSELATLRILKQYIGAKNVEHGFLYPITSFYIRWTIQREV